MKPLFLRKKVILDKFVGETPLQALTRWKDAHPRYKDVPATYAGRLDPMASGKLLILLGEECKKKESYLTLDKVYEVEIVFGVRSDTGDILGKIHASPARMYFKAEIQKALAKEIGTYEREYPVYSSKTVKGKALFVYALEGTVNSITIPIHQETIYDIKLVDIQTVTASELNERICSLLELAPASSDSSKSLGADFRIMEVKESWREVFTADISYQVVKLRVSCGSGSYMRTLSERIGATLGTHALALSIHRTALIKKDR